MADRQPLATSSEVAEYLRVSIRTLDQWAWKQSGPPYHATGKHRRYRWEDVEAWLADKRRESA